MAVVVTGAGGFVGTAVVAQLVREGKRVTGIDRVPMARRAGVRAVHADLCDRDPRFVLCCGRPTRSSTWRGVLACATIVLASPAAVAATTSTRLAPF